LAELGQTGRAGRLAVSPRLTLPDHPEVFNVADAAVVRCGHQLPNKRQTVAIPCPEPSNQIKLLTLLMERQPAIADAPDRLASLNPKKGIVLCANPKA